jgi:nitroreductase
MILDLISKSRSYRRFDHSRSITRAELEAIVEAARLSPSAANLQNLRFYIPGKIRQ